MSDNDQESLLSIADVAKIVARADLKHNFIIDSYTIKSIEEKLGLCCDHAYLKIHLKIQHENSEEHTDSALTCFLKLYPKSELSANFAEGTGAFRKEHFVYNLFDVFRTENVSIVDKCVPQCYLKRVNKLLVLENLNEQGYSSLNKHECLNYEQVQVVLAALAKLHCATLIYEERRSEKTGEPYILLEEFENELEETYFNDKDDFQNRDGLQASFLGITKSIDILNVGQKLLSGKDFGDTLQNVFKKVFVLARPSNKFRNVICHGDLWATNILMCSDKSNYNRCKFVDFQCARYAPPAQDVLAFIYLTTTRAFRKEHMYNLLGFYYSNLEKVMCVNGLEIKKIIPFNSFLSSCEEHRIFAMIQAANYFPLILLKNEIIVEYLQNSELSQRALNEDRSILVEAHISQDEYYKSRIIESLEDLKEYCDYL